MTEAERTKLLKTARANGRPLRESRNEFADKKPKKASPLPAGSVLGGKPATDTPKRGKTVKTKKD